MRSITVIKVGGSIMFGIITAVSLVFNAQGVSQLLGYQVRWQWLALGGFLAFACFMGWIIYGLRQDPAVVEVRKALLNEHFKEIENLIKEWKSGINTPDIFQVELNFSDLGFNWENNRLFSSLEKHLPSSQLWEYYAAWKTKRAEYVDSCKRLRGQIRESWTIKGVELARCFEEPILRLIAGIEKELHYKLYIIVEHGLSQMEYQLLDVNATDVLQGQETKTRQFRMLDQEACSKEILPSEYQRIADDFSASNIAIQTKELLLSTRGLGDKVCGYLEEALLSHEYGRHTCKRC